MVSPDQFAGGLYPLLKDMGRTSLCAIGVGAVLIGAFLNRNPNQANRRTTLPLGTLVVISLIPFYHRSYDAARLISPLGWALLEEPRQSLLTRACPVLVALFFLPGAVLVNVFAKRTLLSPSISGTWWWMSLIVAHQAWVLLLLGMLLLRAMAKAATETSSNSLERPNAEQFAVANEDVWVFTAKRTERPRSSPR